MIASEPSPPASLLLVHGAGSGPWVYEEWADNFPSLRVSAVDLHERLEVSTASMADYAERIVDAARALPQPVSLCGWSMGGLVVLLAAARAQAHSVILIEASPPGEVQGFNGDAEVTQGRFDPEAVYGPFPADVPARPESSLHSSSTATSSATNAGRRSPASTAPRSATSPASTTGILCTTPACVTRSPSSSVPSARAARCSSPPGSSGLLLYWPLSCRGPGAGGTIFALPRPP